MSRSLDIPKKISVTAKMEIVKASDIGGWGGGGGGEAV